MRDLPGGTVTFLFTDIEGSTRLLRELGDGYAEALAEHRRVLRQAFASLGGTEVDTQGDAFFFAFTSARAALAAAAAGQDGLAEGPIHVRMGVHTGEPRVTDEGYVGLDVHRAARIAAAGHGGQVLVSEATHALVDDPDLRDLGEHRLNDLAGPERIYQLGAGDFPPLKSLFRTNLPIAVTPLLGRQRELAEIAGMLSDRSLRLLTLTGPGGVGKTRLALHAAATAAEAFPDGLWWVPLSALTDPSLVPAEMRHALGTQDELATHVAEKRMLFLLDNFEHVIPAASAVASLLAACPNVTVLVTSREALRVAAERRYPVDGLDESAAVTMFTERAQAVDPRFIPTTAVGELCSRLDRLPLAIELAAARVSLFSPDQLLERLGRSLDVLRGGRDIDARQRTLRATIDWSHDLLAAEEQRLFARLAVFAGGCNHEAAETVGDGDPETLQSLIDKSLLRRREAGGEQRLWMLATVQEYARERMQELPDVESLQRRHAESFLALAEKAEPELYGGQQTRWMLTLAVEHDNIRAALRWATESDRHLETRIAVAMGRFWVIHGDWDEGRRWLDRALEHTAGERSDRRVRALAASGLLARVRNEWGQMKRLDEEALDLCRALGDTRGASVSLIGLASAAGFADSDWELAQRLAREAQDLARAIGDTRVEAAARYNLADVALHLHRFEDAVEYAGQASSTFLELDNKELGCLALSVLGLAAVELDRPADAEDALRRALLAAAELGFTEGKATALEGIAALAHDPADAAGLLGYADSVRHHTRARPFIQDRHNKTLAEAEALLGREAADSLYTSGAALEAEDALELALSVAGRTTHSTEAAPS